MLQAVTLLGLLGATSGAPTLGPPPVDGQGIAGGSVPSECAFPTAVALPVPGGFCTGLLVHPELVIYAAHCGQPRGALLMGESANRPKRSLTVDACELNPGYRGQEDLPEDFAFCRLAQPVTDVRPTPPAFGCELEQVRRGDRVTMVGYGNPDMGEKRMLETFVSEFSDERVVAGGGGDGGCKGDSGGPLFFQLDDGSWRTIGIASTASRPAGCEAGTDGDGVTNYARVDNGVAWFESRTGLDLTPCHDPDGTWNPGPECVDFATFGPTGGGSWSQGCQGPVQALPASCGPGYGQVDESTTGSSTGGGGSEDGSGPGPTGSATTGTDSAGVAADVTGGDETVEPETGVVAGTESGEAGGSDGGGSCSVSTDGSSLATALMCLGLVGRHRRRLV